MKAFIHDVVRTPRGKGRSGGGLSHLMPEELVAALVEALAVRGRDPQRAEQLILSSVGQVDAQGGHIAMIAKLKSGLDEATAAHTMNNFCAGGLSAIGHAAAAVAAGQADRVLAGGVEMLSRVAFMADRASYYTATDMEPEKRYMPVALAADILAQKLEVTRAELDAVALVSQDRAAAAEGRPGLQASRIAVGGLATDEAVRSTTSMALAALPPAFAGLGEQYREVTRARDIDHRHTLGHAPPLADGAGLAMVGGADGAPRARILAFAERGGNAFDSLTAGYAAMDAVLARTGLRLRDMDRVEFMEAFAVTIARFLRDFDVDPARVNVGGGHIAKGHPMGATGAILTSALLDALDECGGQLGLVVASGAQGVGVAMIIERLR